MPARVADLDWTVERAHALPDDGIRYEVLSPSTARADRYRKRAIYLDEGVGEYWIVDAGQRLIERRRPGDSEPQEITEELVWSPREGVAPLTLEVVNYFDEVETYPLG